MLFKNFIGLTVTIVHAFYSGFSGYFQIPGLLAALLSVNMCLFLQALFVTFHKDINFDKYGRTLEDEQKLPFRMSEMYVSRNQHIGRFFKDYLANAVWGIVVGVFVFYQWLMFESNNGIGLANGWVLNSDAWGVHLLLVLPIVADLYILRFVRHWDWLFVAITVFSVFWIPFDLWREQGMASSSVRQTIFPIFLSSPVYLLNVLLSISVIMLPYYVIGRWRTVVLESKLYSTV
jgi:hypothetical protein